MRYKNELAYRDLIQYELADNEYFGEMIHEKLIYYPTVTREAFYNQGRITEVVESGQLFEDIGLPPINPDHDRAMICGSPAMLEDVGNMLQVRGFKPSPRIGVTGDYVIERAFVEK